MSLALSQDPWSALLIEPGERATAIRPLAAGPAAGVRPGAPRSARILSSSRPRPPRCWSIPRRPADHSWDMTPRSPTRSRPPLLPDAPCHRPTRSRARHRILAPSRPLRHAGRRRDPPTSARRRCPGRRLQGHQPRRVAAPPVLPPIADPTARRVDGLPERVRQAIHRGWPEPSPLTDRDEAIDGPVHIAVREREY